MNIKYARACDITGEGMNEGYCIGDGHMYIKYEVDLIKHIRDAEKEGSTEYTADMTDEFLLNDYYNAEYYTEWKDEDNFQYEEINDNKLIAEFMGYTHQSDSAFKDESGFWNDFEVFETWDWLMPVVAKCFDIYHIEQKNDDLNFKFYDSIGDIKATYKAVAEFIKKYNDETEV